MTTNLRCSLSFVLKKMVLINSRQVAKKEDVFCFCRFSRVYQFTHFRLFKHSSLFITRGVWANRNAYNFIFLVGLKYGILDTDCCDCQVVKCVDCKSTTTEDKICPRGEGAKPTDCYKYTQNHEQDKTTGCWSSHCEAKSSDASNSVSIMYPFRDMEADDFHAASTAPASIL